MPHRTVSGAQSSAVQCLAYNVIVAQLLSHVRLFTTPWTAAHQAPLIFTISQSLLKLLSIESVMPSNHLVIFHPLLLMPSIFPSIRAFSNELALCIRWPKYWSFSCSISPSNEYSGLISFRIDWFDHFLAVQKPQFNSLNSSALSLPWRREWLLTPGFLPGKFHGQRSLVG